LTNAIQKIQDVQEERLRRTALFTLKFSLFLCAFFLVRSLQWEIYGRVLSLSLCMGLVLISIIVLKRGGSRAVASIVALIGGCITVAYATYSSGGLGNPASGWLGVLPLIGVLVGGKQGGSFAFIFALVTGLGIFALESWLGVLENLTPVRFRLSQDRFNQLGQLVFISVSLIGLFRQIKFSEEQLSDTVIKLSNEVEARTLAEQKAGRASKIKSEFLANMSHEIRTPMNGIIGMLNILKQEKLTAKQKNFIELARSSSDTLMVVINDILDLNKIESGKFELEEIDFNLSRLINEIQQIKSLNANEKGLYFDFEIDLYTKKVHGDPVRLRQIIDNLINNALKFTSSGGLSLNASLVQKNNNRCLFSFSVEDTGIGIPQDKLALLFTPFLQMEASTTRRFGGTGLGLSISKQLIDLMKGSMGVSSNEGKGSCFYFTLDLGVCEQHSTHQTVHGEVVENKKTIIEKDQYLPILLVEDSEINIIVAQAILEKFPVKVDVAKNGVQAIKMINQNQQSGKKHYQAVFMDCQMPEMDGYQTSIQLRKKKEYNNLPIIAMTANAMKGDKEKCLAAGMSDYVSKPIKIKVIEEKLLKWMCINRL
jgi:signal transduction histidine kinase/CheY-like chemotaxis protein